MLELMGLREKHGLAWEEGRVFAWRPGPWDARIKELMSKYVAMTAEARG